MLNKPTQSSSSDAQLQNSNSNFSKKSQHGIQHHNHDSLLIRRPILVDVPAETLTSITAHLDPPTLLILGGVNKYLNHHIKDDNTWRRAFANQFLGIGPESDLIDEKMLLFRRTERSWRHEFILRFRLRRRWERSRSVTTSHIPVNHLVHGMHLMPSHGLLTASLEYGVVARSLPLTGKILSGFLDASGSRAGLGIGNPNAEFTPNISTYNMASEGGIAKVVWGSRVGDVLFLNAPRTMEGSGRRSATDSKVCNSLDAHEGAVLNASWIDANSGWAVTGGVDGRIKLWDAKTARCTWASEPILASLIPDHVLKVAGSATRTFVVGVVKSGNIHLWTGFDMMATNPTLTDPLPQEVIIPNPHRTSDQDYDPNASHLVISLHVDSSAGIPTILVAYENDPYFYRIWVDAYTKAVDITTYGEPYFGNLSIIVPFFGSFNHHHTGLVMAGDLLGCVNFYAWNTKHDSTSHNPSTTHQLVTPFRKLEVFQDGAAVTAIAWNGFILACGSVLGSTIVFDGTTLERLRLFPSPMGTFRPGRGPLAQLSAAAEAATAQVGQNDLAQILQQELHRQQREWEKVRQIVLGQDKDVIFVGVGDKVMAWKAGPISKYASGKHGGVRGRNTSGVLPRKQHISTSRYFAQKEIDKAIFESHDILLDQATSFTRQNHSHSTAEAQRTGLASLGLNEVEALEYVLMLSRDEATTPLRTEEDAFVGASGSQNQQQPTSVTEEGVFEIDHELASADGSVRNDRIAGPTGVSYSTSSGSASSSSSKSSITTSPSAGQHIPRAGSRSGSGIPRFSPSPTLLTNQKVQVSPPHRAEPMEAGLEWNEDDPSNDPDTDEAVGGTRLGLEDHYFPTLVEGSGSSGSERRKTEVPAKSAKKGKDKANAKETKSRKEIQSKAGVLDAAIARTHCIVTPPTTRASAWTTPFTKRMSTSPPTTLPHPSSAPPTRSAGPSTSVAGLAEADLDEDLRFALEMSLAEAMSRGDKA
ncbi:hypothetical protein CPB83DRAFT_299653 [Crepidotus variabilis]|uniref:F-box domain-containing protein n=1 Tax=Crepidotus variabilis TaxID=179855 RepID=A0A9P6JQ37_9AGAR|nr:hypothetical protein CPB83DRAFT_299653 [Crepidotus variabilis]